jgi:maltose O-acetyltransferase
MLSAVSERGAIDGGLRRRPLTGQVMRILSLALYYSVATRLPGMNSPVGKPCRWLRQQLCKGFLDGAGARINIGPAVHLGTGADVRIGNRSGVGRGSRLYGAVTIGEEVMLGPEVTILSANHHYAELDRPIGWQGMTPERAPRIEDGAWIGTKAIILPGRVIGKGAVVGAGSVVTRDVAPFAIVGGNPAVVIGWRRPGPPDA